MYDFNCSGMHHSRRKTKSAKPCGNVFLTRIVRTYAENSGSRETPQGVSLRRLTATPRKASAMERNQHRSFNRAIF
ncbi:hypothetical protein EJF36_09315 [Bacillus sp. HMF5848]|nr:hypothetical protein EJF36_09315 [Bacillus sp. HMF5848]